MNAQGWLPTFVEFDGDWNNFDAYTEKVYAVFVQDFVARRPPMLGKSRVSLRRHPEFKGKGASFWHLVTEGKIEDARYPDVERCRRIGWVRPILERAGDRTAVRVWKNRRGSDERLLIALPEFDYVVILQQREDAKEKKFFFLLLTAYPVAQAHRREKLRAEHDVWLSARTKG